MSNLNHKDNAAIFKALSDEKRLEILKHLRDGEKCACVLIDKIDMGQSALSYHMKILCKSGIVESRTDGKLTLYKISKNGSKRTINLLGDITSPNEKQVPNDYYFDNLRDPSII